ncbi:succinylglutamate desuccinylase [Parvibium lacunae]|uniref:Succinylglutamate desuccinylase n=1 Tax=Parvibium lacunae TaxID=1888893 RepID=A0A368L507_9BURK|nr:succinylglutamate desuccinylase [Parvibium lacunae]
MPTGIAIHQFASLQAGPRLIILGAVHGNEVCGTLAIRRLMTDIEQGRLILTRGHLTLVPITNPLAFQLKRRHGDRNLNRNMRESATPQDFEDHLANVLCPLLKAHDVLLDLHSFHTPGTPFALIGPSNNHGEIEPFTRAHEEEALALALGVSRFVEGWLETYAQGVKDRQARGAEANIDYGVGTTETMRRYGGIAITLECGQHEEDAAPQIAYQAILNTLHHLNMIRDAAPPAPAAAREVIRLYRVIDRLHPDDTFSRAWQSFESVQYGDLIAHRHDGTALIADRDGWIVFPNPNAQVNQEWFYLAEKSSRLNQG